MAIKLSSNNGNIQLTSAGGKIIRGIDGGYYTPAIDAEGNLTWIASLEDMSDVPATNIKGPKGDPGATGKDGEPGAKGDTGAAFTYDMFTKEQLASLKGDKGDKGDTGAKGDPFTYNDFTSEQLAALTGPAGAKGEKGDNGSTGADGVGISSIIKTGTSGKVDTYTITLTNGNTSTFTITNGTDGINGTNGKDGANGADGAAATIQIGTVTTGIQASVTNSGTANAAILNFSLPKGDPFTYNDFTSEQLAALKGEKGDKGDTGATGPQGNPGTTDYNELENKPIIPTVPTNVGAFTNDAGYLTSVPAEYVTETELESKGYLTEHQSISGKEDNSNKVTSLSASSTDTQYPSAKCVYDAIGDVETILNTLNDGGGAQ